MTYDVTVVKTQTCVVRTEAECPMDALKYVQMNAQLRQFKNLHWKDVDLYAKDVEQIEN